jgi:hypothetical protein
MLFNWGRTYVTPEPGINTWTTGGTLAEGLPASPVVVDMDVGSIFRMVFDSDEESIKVMDVGTASGTIGSDYFDCEGILQRVVDTSNKALRIVQVSGGSGATTGRLDWRQVFEHIYDPTKRALRVVVNPTTIAMNAHLDAEQIISKLYDHANCALRVTTIGTASTNMGTKLDWRQVFRHALDATHGQLWVVSGEGTPEVAPGGGDFPDRYFAPRYFAPGYWS